MLAEVQASQESGLERFMEKDSKGQNLLATLP
jgi:hypothetical protein